MDKLKLKNLSSDLWVFLFVYFSVTYGKGSTFRICFVLNSSLLNPVVLRCPSVELQVSDIFGSFSAFLAHVLFF